MLATVPPRNPHVSKASMALLASLLVMACYPLASTVSAKGDVSFNERVESISASDMLATVSVLQGFGSRAFALNETKEVAEYIHGRFHGLGLTVEYQNFTFADHSSSNVVAIVNGTDPEAGVLLFGAHYDSENSLATTLELAETLQAPGADDDASGVAAVLELAEALRDARTRQTLKFVAFGAEESGFDSSGGLRGSTHFAQTEKAADVIYECAVIMDMIGYSNDPDGHGTMIVAEEDLPFVHAMEQAVDSWQLELGLEILVAPQLVYSDHAPFWSLGYPAVLVIEELTDSHFPVNPYYHSAYDTVGKLSGKQMENITRCILGAALSILEFTEEDQDWTPFIGMIVVVAVGVTITLIVYSRRHSEGES